MKRCKCGREGYRTSTKTGTVLCRGCYDTHLYNSHWFVRSLKWCVPSKPKTSRIVPLPGQRELFWAD
jgi:hypothetical protein